MAKRGFILFLFVVLFFTCSITGEGRLRFIILYEVQEGDTLIGIANNFNVSLEDLLKANGLEEKSIIHIYDELVIPYSSKEEIPDFNSSIMSPIPFDQVFNLGQITQIVRIQKNPTTEEIPLDKTILYRIQPGDNLYSLARYFNTTIRDIMALNNLDDTLLTVGQEILLPTYTLTPRQTFSHSVTQGELDLLARVISGEARGEPLLGQVAVGAVIINRVLHPSFPNTLQEVIYQPNQFSAVFDGQFNHAPTTASYIAARRALDGEDPTMGSLYFYNPRTAINVAFFERVTKTIEIGNHVFGY